MRRIPVVGVVWRELEVPFQLARGAVERDYRARVEIVAGAGVAIPVGAGVADAPIDEIQVGIVRARHPRRTPARLPRFAGPGFVTGLARAGDRQKAPGARARLRVVGVDKTADAGLAAAGPDQDLIADGEGREGHAVPELVVLDLGGPPLQAALGVERDQVAIEGRHENLVVEDSNAAVHAPESDGVIVVGNGAAPRPEFPARARVERRRGIRTADVHHTVHHDRRDLGAAVGELIRPFDPQSRDIGRSDLGQRRVSMTLVIARVCQPVPRLLGRVGDALVGDLRERRGAEHERQPLHDLPRRAAR